jgi:uncharacterized paraquat-inducible protein A
MKDLWGAFLDWVLQRLVDWVCHHCQYRTRARVRPRCYKCGDMMERERD